MIKEEGYIIYTTKDNPVPAKKEIGAIRPLGRDLEIYALSLGECSKFYYSDGAKKWYVFKNGSWVEFNGEVLSFQYRTYLSTGLQEARI